MQYTRWDPRPSGFVKTNKDPVCKSDFTDPKYGCFDTEFVISEVNADYTYWKDESSEKGWTLLNTFPKDPWDDFSTIGLSISTKRWAH